MLVLAYYTFWSKYFANSVKNDSMWLPITPTPLYDANQWGLFYCTDLVFFMNIFW